MSSSAFTPTQIEVTNNVPVNVPVVTRDTFFVPSIGISGTFASQKGEYQRSGNRMNARVQLTFATVSAINSPYTLTIPDSLNYDGSNIPVSDEPIVGTFSLWDASASYIEYIGTVHVNSATTLKFKAHGQTAFNNSSVPVTIAANDILEIQFSLPIAEWSGSGTTTLATRAVEEYAWNSSTSTLDDSTSFAYGPSGVTFKAFAPTGVNYVYRRVRFQTAIQATDSILLEINDGTTNNWLPAASAFYPYQQNDAGTTNYGIAVTRVGGSSTDVDVRFFSQATKTSGDTWSANSTWKWRLRKVSSGAQVGYPVSARNIVGDTSGSVVPTGMVGEVRSFTARTIAAVTTGMTASAALDTLPAGRWHIVPNVTATAAASATTIEVIISSNNANDGTGSIGSYSAANTSGVTSGNWGFPLQNCILDVSTSQILYAKAQSTGANRNAIVSGYAIRIA